MHKIKALFDRIVFHLHPSGPGTLPAPMVIQTEFKKPTLVPATLRCMAPVNGDMWRDALTPEGFAFCVKGSDGADVLTGRIIRGATAS